MIVDVRGVPIDIDEEYLDYRRFIKTRACDECVGVPGFETPGPGCGVAQRKFDDNTPVLVWEKDHDGMFYPYFVTFRWFQQFVRNDNLEAVVHQFFEKVFLVANKRAGFQDGIFAWSRRFMAWADTHESPHEFESHIINLLSQEDRESVINEIARWLTPQPDGCESFYTYDYDHHFTQDFEWTIPLSWRNPSDRLMWMSVIFHTGVDARCGFAGPVFVRVYHGEFAWDRDPSGTESTDYHIYTRTFDLQQAVEKVFPRLHSYRCLGPDPDFFIPAEDIYGFRSLLQLCTPQHGEEVAPGYFGHVTWVIKPLDELEQLQKEIPEAGRLVYLVKPKVQLELF